MWCMDGSRIKTERLRLGLTQVELAAVIDVTSTCVSRYERGVMTPSVATLRKLARVFGRSLDDLAGEDKSAA